MDCDKMNSASSQSDVLDPHRPWITDARQLPSRMRWLDAMFNPAGTSPTLHFTRVWTLCFFLQLMIVVGPFGIGLLMSLAGGNAAPVTTFGLYASPIVFIVTTIISFINHSRRLNDARKPSIFAVIVLVPMIIGLGLTGMGIMGKAKAYDKLYAERTEYLADPDAWRAARLEKQREAQQKAEEARQTAEAAGEKPAAAKPNGANGGRGDRGPRADRELPSQLDFVLKPNVGVIQLVSIGLNIFIAIWSLLWVARVPDFGRSYQGHDGGYS